MLASSALTPQKALIFRITHRDNIPWILDHGLHCGQSPSFDVNHRSIGNPELITRRRQRTVPIPPGGTLDDYVPFYFTPHSPMLLNIKTGRGVARLPNEEVVVVVSSLHNLASLSVSFVFTDRHAYLTNAEFFDDMNRLDRIDWDILQRRDFRRDTNDPGKIERYQAEALAHRHVPTGALLAIGCYNSEVETSLMDRLSERNLGLRTVVRPGWYF